MKIATDAPSRNSLNKLQAALTKVIAEAGISRTGAEGATVIDKAQEEPIAIENLEAEKDVKEELAETEGLTVTQESLLEELLQDEEEEL